MKQSTLNNMARIVSYMKDVGWAEKAAGMGFVDRESESYCEAIKQTFTNLTVRAFELAETRYLGYAEIVENMDRPELHDSILQKHTQLINGKMESVKAVENEISELIFLLEDFQERIKETGNLPANIPAGYTPKTRREQNVQG